MKRWEIKPYKLYGEIEKYINENFVCEIALERCCEELKAFDSYEKCKKEQAFESRVFKKASFERAKLKTCVEKIKERSLDDVFVNTVRIRKTGTSRIPGLA